MIGVPEDFFAGPGLPQPAPLAEPRPAASFRTGEFKASWGLGAIGAEQAYALGAYGAGVTVAVVDTGIDTGHADLAANISPASTDIVAPGSVLADPDGHGTAVAGTVAASRNGADTHGVAFGSTILAIRADNHCASPPCVFFYRDLARAVHYAIDHQAHIVNMSLGGPSPPDVTLRLALERAVRNGTVVVAAAGNSEEADPSYPAASATDPALAGLLLAVVAVDDRRELADFSNRCGAAKNFCLAAPGVDIVTIRAGGGTTTVGGTSFSAPHVSGAVALLLQLFPSLSAADAVQVLLRSAIDLGPPGVDETYGHGLLDLATAVEPLGPLEVPLEATASGTTGELAATSLTLGPAFGDALSGESSLSRAIALDGFDRPYRVDLRDAVRASRSGLGLEELLAFDGTSRHSLSLPGGHGVAFAFEQAEEPAPASEGSLARRSDRRAASELRSIELVASLSETGRLRFTHGAPPAAMSDFAAIPYGAAPFWRPREMFDASSQLLAQGTGVALALDLPADLRLGLGWFAASGDGPDGGAGGGSMARAELRGRLGRHLTLGATASFLDESDGFLGSRSDGAFGDDTAARSLFLSLAGRLALGPDIDLFGGYTLAGTRLSIGSASLLDQWDTVLADAFGAGIAWRSVLGPRDRLGFLVGQPLRVFHARADLRVPTGMRADRSIVWSERRLDVTPGGREIDLQLVYDRAVSPRLELGAWILGRLEPGHDRSADPDFGGGVKLDLRF